MTYFFQNKRFDNLDEISELIYHQVTMTPLTRDEILAVLDWARARVAEWPTLEMMKK
jgi:hypothetical protein